jgi:hypothetical protein
MTSSLTLVVSLAVAVIWISCDRLVVIIEARAEVLPAPLAQ